MNGLLEKRVFEIISISKIHKNIRILSSCFMNEIKNVETANALEKSRLVVQVYNDYDKISILIQSPTIQ